MEDYYPPFRFSPFYYRNRYYYRQNRLNQSKSQKAIDENKSSFKDEKHHQNSASNDFASRPVFELFGVELFFDDILLISLIFFLYNEGVQDQFLFIALILLLLS